MTWRKFREEFWWLFANIIDLFGGYDTRLWWWFTHRTIDVAHEGYVWHDWAKTRYIDREELWPCESWANNTWVSCAVGYNVNTTWKGQTKP